MAEDEILSVRAMVMGGDIDLFKGCITEHGSEVGNLEGLTRLQAVILLDAWFQKQVKNKALTASHSTLKMLEKMPVINSAVDALTSSKLSTFPNDLKTSEQMDCKMGISYSSLHRQIENVNQRLQETDIINAVLKAIPPTFGLRRYLEGKELVCLGSCIQILRAHYNETRGP